MFLDEVKVPLYATIAVKGKNWSEAAMAHVEILIMSDQVTVLRKFALFLN
jgi:hypothetical protein